MSSTDFFVAISGEPARAAPFGAACRFNSPDEQSVVKDVLNQSAERILLLAFVVDKSVGKALCRAMFTYFAECIDPSKNVYVQFNVSFVEEKTNSLIQYRCERLGDIDAVIEAEGGAHDCSSICATRVVPKETSFVFVEQRLTVMLCTASEYNSDKLMHVTENAAAMVGCQIGSVGFYIPRDVMCSPVNLEELAKEGELFRELVSRRTIGHEERVSSRVRLQDVRAWSLMINEKNHFSAVEPGPYLVSLNPQLVVGEKLAHYVMEELTYMVGDSGNASPVDFCVMPPVADGDALHRSVYSPHCRLRREGYAVYIKPECGMTYVNGKLIAEEQLLHHNDRIILGKQLAFRFVIVGTEVPKNPDSRILDWELCSKEFRRESERVIESGIRSALETNNNELRARCEELEGLLENARGNSWLMLTNPPPTYKGQCLWPFDLRKRHSAVTIGPQGDVALPFLTASATLKHAMDGLICKSGNATVAISNGARFNVGAYTFAMSIDERVAPGRTRKESTLDGGTSADAVLELQSSFFSLQWAIGALFDFVFPVKGRRVKREGDKYYAYRAPLYDTHLLEAPAVHTTDVVALNTQLTEAVRVMGAGLAKEMREMTAGSPPPSPSSSPSPSPSPRGDASAMAKAEDFLRSVAADTELTTAVMRQVHHEIGSILYERCNGQQQQQTSRQTQLSTSPKLPKSPKSVRARPKDRLHEASPLTPPSPPSAGNTEGRLLRLKGTCFMSSPKVLQRASNTVTLLSVSTNAKGLWEQHVQHVGTIGKSFSQTKGDDANLLTELLLLIVDAVLSTDYCLRHRLLKPREVESLEPKLALWQKWADKCVGAMEGQTPLSRSAWKHESAVQRKPTPHIHRSAAKRGGDAPTPTRNPADLDHTNGSRKTSLSRMANSYTSVPPRLTGDHNTSRSALSATYSGKTSQSLTSFGTLRKLSVSSATKAQSARGLHNTARRSSTTATPNSTNSTNNTTTKQRSPATGSSGVVAPALSARRKVEAATRKKK
ncbi:hypothetical protein ABB37_01479 [Leptomonas pyrrhocoris]|uniref:FHA domain-containing protein n=1 Tax=Leptomonas pyrrhocoris TaxID=157538 RepID=A0A0N0DZD4_LEPPY|nr:hypothetical protein ABB37_01479 [Leptomonas pyrrhocoris]KPA85062.1 hypothetical protein ABB37_01479 [Leptomonas pyrrhocoris]|eukprot:XP_015663501.1 hypothetical protein ABB37_01479 [Leptomonas pyrrhocoris]